jgi:hypothetical protein
MDKMFPFQRLGVEFVVSDRAEGGEGSTQVGYERNRLDVSNVDRLRLNERQKREDKIRLRSDKKKSFRNQYEADVVLF